ncbi:MAG: bifunctional methylenetetrahydrofolate dehydrogenase/methenyltetrahydrofolate cyclohydrolase FolD [Syntrophales bacterium]|jgi:methylenetetrahydrofolate dehydrogenase (NADP+)/methenyltetrahydrofolate cyclohydrolase|nr:bifunctional methylenetetrahydrofolate dehydrogenase/methenyltetrahydrofolate cyclohydrolase FolD [Syntrophales bacterium]MCK9528254.1 bifunctional methylenetetrahydrofolate dehydrogenase/methenyltetrahydrofolate cyclohydrolase FolD [Syntrophales bacterium]MDX9922385.1 bifunctional methylenetetrahydrofolate dehydrogenase/methenyltetrahydrofolate cyclohydrolase FolD [Syntrophales bacterium]
MAVIIDGKSVAEQVRKEIREKTLRLSAERAIQPGLAVVLLGDDPASGIYVRGKKAACEQAGFLSRELLFPGHMEERELLSVISELNHDDRIHGILVQLPLPKHLDPDRIVESIKPEKDVDGFNPWNVGKLFSGTAYHMSCTPLGIIELLDRYGIAIEGREAVIVGRSAIVGKPLALMLLARHATVTICHTRTRNLADVTRRADILVAAAGQPEIIQGDMVKNGAVVIDVGINRSPDGKLLGDVAFDEVEPLASHITPVPGGVGPMTIAMLMVNTFNAASRS